MCNERLDDDGRHGWRLRRISAVECHNVFKKCLNETITHTLYQQIQLGSSGPVTPAEMSGRAEARRGATDRYIEVIGGGTPEEIHAGESDLA